MIEYGTSIFLYSTFEVSSIKRELLLLNVFDKKVRFKNEDVRFTNSNIKIDSNTTIDLNGVKLTEVGTPSNSADAATKGYVDDLIAGSNEIGELTDVTLSGASTGQILKYNGSAWVNTAEVNELNELIKESTKTLKAETKAEIEAEIDPETKTSGELDIEPEVEIEPEIESDPKTDEEA